MSKAPSPEKRRSLFSYAKKHARTFPGTKRKGERLNLAAIVDRYQITREQFKHRRKLATQAGKPLELVKEPLGHFGRNHDTFFESEVREAIALVQFPKLVDGGQFTWQSWEICHDTKGRAYGTLKCAVETKKLPRTSIPRWADKKTCRYLGRKIKSRLVTPPTGRNVDKVRVYLIEDLDTINESPHPSDGIETEKDELGTWLPAKQLCEEVDVTLMFPNYWKEKPSKMRPGEKALRKKSGPNRKAGPITVEKFLLEDANNILAGKEGDSPGSGRGRAAIRLSKIKREDAKKTLRTFLRARGPCSPGFAQSEMHAQGLSCSAFYRAQRDLGCKARPTDGRSVMLALPGQKFPPSKAAAFMEKESESFPALLAGVKQRALKAGIGTTAFKTVLDNMGIEKVITGGPWYLRLPGQEVPKLPLEKLNGGKTLLSADLRPHRKGRLTYWSVRGAFQQFPKVMSAFRNLPLLAHYLQRFREYRSRILRRRIHFVQVARKTMRGTAWVYEESDILRLAEARLNKAALGANGEANGHANGNGFPNGHLPAAGQAKEGQAEREGNRVAVAPRNRGGRPRDAETQAIYQFCWEHRSEKAVRVMRLANAHFGKEVITDVRRVRENAERYERRRPQD